MGPIADIFGRTGLELDTVLDENGNVPASVILQGFRILAPVAQVSQYVNLWEKLWNDEYVAAYSAMTEWGSDHIPFPGAAARQTVEMLVRGNGFLHDRLELGGDRVSLKTITVPFLTVLATRDHIVPQPAAAPLLDLVGSAEKDELRLDAGHMGLVVGRTAAHTTIPRILRFLRERSEALS
jgi:polyhydroxyalkanoate synthase